MSDIRTTIHDRLEDILESIELIQEWSKGRTSVDDFITSSTGVMAFNACVMRFQVIGEHVGKTTNTPWIITRKYLGTQYTVYEILSRMNMPILMRRLLYLSSTMT